MIVSYEPLECFLTNVSAELLEDHYKNIKRIKELESALSTIVDWFESRCEVPTGKPFSEEEAELHDLAKEALGRKE